jgi:hypothetical protein
MGLRQGKSYVALLQPDQRIGTAKKERLIDFVRPDSRHPAGLQQGMIIQ